MLGEGYNMRLGGFFLFASLLGSNAAYAELQVKNCGPLYGGLTFQLKDGTSSRQLANKFKNVSWARQIYETNNDWAGYRNASFYARLLPEKGETSFPTEQSIEVPIGSEEFLASQLRATGLTTDITLLSGGCGGAEVAYFSLGTVRDQQSLKQPANFQNLIRLVSEEYVSSRQIAGLESTGIIEMKGFNAFSIPPNLPVGRVRFRVASEISRDDASKKSWDQFDVIFSLWKLENLESLVTVSIERYKNAPRAGRKLPPGSEYFREPAAEEWDTEMIISANIAAFFARHFNSLCIVEGEGFFEDSKGYPKYCSDSFEEEQQ
jgi:hypothetical protein